MSIMRFFLHLIIIFILLAPGKANAFDKSTLLVGVDPTLPPYSYMENLKLTGIYVEVTKFIGNELNMKCQFKDMKFASLIPALNNNIIDIASMAITDKRKENVDFSDSFGFVFYSMVFLKNSNIEDDIRKLKNKKITLRLGSSEEHWLENNINKDSNYITKVDSASEAIEHVKAGNADLVLMHTISAKYVVKQNPNLEFRAVDGLKLGIAFAVKKNVNSKLLIEINRILKDKKNEIQKIVDSCENKNIDEN